MQPQSAGNSVRKQPDLSGRVPLRASLLDALPEFRLVIGDGQCDCRFILDSTRCGKDRKLLFIDDDFNRRVALCAFPVSAVADADKGVTELAQVALGAGLAGHELLADACVLDCRGVGQARLPVCVVLRDSGTGGGGGQGGAMDLPFHRLQPLGFSGRPSER